MFSSLFTEVKLKGMGQGFPGLNPSGGQAFMYQAQTQTPAPLQPAPATPTSVVPSGATPVLPPTPAGVTQSGNVVGGGIPQTYIVGAIAFVAFVGAMILPSSR